MNDNIPTRRARAALVCGALLATAAGVHAARSHAEPPADAEPPTAADLLATLPDGEQRRRFIIDCTGCHTFHAGIGWPAGERRTRQSWADAAASMLARFGPHSGFPVIGERDAAATAAWLDANLPVRPPAARARLPDSASGRAEYREYSMPVPGDLPHDVALDGERVVITGMFTGVMYVLDPATGEMRAEPTPAPNPRAIEIDAAGNWWVVLGGPRMLARRSPDGSWTTWDAGFYAHSVALGTDGGVWLNGHFTHDPELVRRIEPASGSHHDYALPAHPEFSVTTVPYEIRTAPDGSVWMSELQGNRIVRIAHRTGDVRAWTLPTPWSGPRRFDIDPDGVLWIPAYGANLLVRFDPRTEEWAEYELPLPATAPYIARWDPRRRQVWVGTGAGDVVFRFDPADTRFRGYVLPSRDQLVRHMAVDTVSGDIWLAPGSSPGTVPARVVRMRILD
jgi:streptogramin lyase